MEKRKNVRAYLLKEGIQGKIFQDTNGKEYMVEGIKKRKDNRIYLDIIDINQRHKCKPLVDCLDDLTASTSSYHIWAQKITAHIKKSFSQTLLELREEEDY